MIRTLWVVLCACCVAVVLSEICGVGLLWSRGLLTVRRLREMRELLGPQEKEPVAFDTEAQRAMPSSQDVLRERSLRVLSLSSLETEVGLLKSMLDTERTSLSTQTAEFQKQKNAFKAQLQQLTEENTVAAREQARAVLQALSPPDAVERLMQIPVEEDVLLLREMPEPKIAAILKEMAPAPEEGADASAAASKTLQNRTRRAKEIFDQLTKGEPRNSIIRSALNNLQQAESEPTGSTATK